MSGRGLAWYDPADLAEAAAYEAHRELDMPRRHRLDVDREIASERRAMTNIDESIAAATPIARTCAYCPADATATCSTCEEWVCADDLIDGRCPDCIGLTHGNPRGGRRW